MVDGRFGVFPFFSNDILQACPKGRFDSILVLTRNAHQACYRSQQSAQWRASRQHLSHPGVVTGQLLAQTCLHRLPREQRFQPGFQLRPFLLNALEIFECSLLFLSQRGTLFLGLSIFAVQSLLLSRKGFQTNARLLNLFCGSGQAGGASLQRLLQLRSALDGLSIGIGSTAALVTLGGLRELVGQGTLFSQAHLMLGEWARLLELALGAGFHGALAAILPPGAFIGLGCLIALKNVIDKRAARRAEAVPVAPAQPT